MTAPRVEQIGDATLYLADCMDVLPSLGGVDAVVTDPPYGIGKRMQGGTWGNTEKYVDFRRWDKVPPTETISVILNNAPEIIIWGGNFFGLPPSRCWLVWDKTNAMPTVADVEIAWTNLDKPAKRLSLPVGNHAHGHPTEKPLRLMTWCLSFIPDARTILDPFMGSGTTGVACARLGRRFIGIEIEPKYFDIACQRIEAAYKQADLFIPAPAPKAMQEPLL